MAATRLSRLGRVAAAGCALAGLSSPSAFSSSDSSSSAQRLWCWGRLVPSPQQHAPATAEGGGESCSAPTARLKSRSPIDVTFWSERGRRVEQLSFGEAHGAALDDRGELWVWGGRAGALCVPTRLPAPGRGKYTRLSSTDDSLYAITSRGAVVRWPHLSKALEVASVETAADGASPHTPALPSPVVLGGNLGDVSAVGISSGAAHVLVTSSSGRVYAFGENERGQLGVGAAPDDLDGLHSEEAQQVKGLPKDSKVVQTACGRAHCLALLADGRVFSWGDDRNLQLGQRDDSIKSLKRGAPFLSTPAQVTGPWMDGKRVVAIAAGGGGIEGGHSAFLLAAPVQAGSGRSGYSSGIGANAVAEELWCCGYGRWGQLGTKAYCHISPPKQVTTLAKLREYDEKTGMVVPLRIAALGCGDRHTAAILSSGNLFVWGWNEHGQLGNGGSQGTHTPIMIKAPADLRLSRVTKLACGPNSTAVW